MNRQIRRVAAIIMGLYAVLFVRLNVVQVVQADSLNSHPANNRQLIRDFEKPPTSRGISGFWWVPPASSGHTVTN